MAFIRLAGARVETAESVPICSPWDGHEVDRCGLADDAQLEHAVSTAHAAWRSLAGMPSHRRRDLLERISRSVAARREDFAQLIAREAGKPIVLARAEVDRAARTFALGAEEATRLGGDAMSLDLGPAADGVSGAWTRASPGPILAITPFNFPLNLVAHKLAPAFALGAPTVLKPAPQAPLTALALADVVRDAGAPEALLSVVPTTVERAQRLARDPRFAVLSFTGSARVGWMLREHAGRMRVLLELGGNAAVIVEPDADVERALDRLVPAAYGYAGQVCIKAQRIYVQRTLFERVRDALVARTASVRVLDPMLGETLCGPVIDAAAGERIRAWIDVACRRGARRLVGGGGSGNRIEPCVVTDAPEGTQLVDEEVFGPVVTMHPYDTLDEALGSVERGRYGLQASLFTHDVRAITKVFGALRVGALVVNDAPTFRVDSMPYGGVKDSGVGREGVRFAIDEMAEKKLLVVRSEGG